MDTFFEQIVSIKKSGKNITAICVIWVIALILSALLFLSMLLGSLTFLVIAGILYGAFKLTGKFNIEYEYIVTNGTFDIDKIINKSSRKRIASFDISTVSRLDKYNEGQLSGIDTKNVVFACNGDSDNTYLLVYQKEGKPAVYVVFEPNDKMKSATVKYLPKFISNSAFK